MTKDENEQSRRLLLTKASGEKVLVENIPAKAKVTFGKVAPTDREYTLRIYTNEQNQLAVFTGVTSFRDLSLTVKEQKIHRKNSSRSESKPDDGYVMSQDIEVESEWAEVPF